MKYNKMWIRGLGIAGLIIIASLFTYMTMKPGSDDEAYLNAMRHNYKIFSVPIPDTLSLAGEAVPLDLYWVREGLDKELLSNTYFHSHTILLLKKAYRYFPLIEPILKEKGIPDDFKYLIMIESGFSNTVSPAGAAGFWQLMKKTAQEYGLEVSDDIDERYHLLKSTEAAARYLTESKLQFGSWTLAAAAYNAGKSGISRRLEEQKVSDYYNLKLNQETGRYIFRILAMKLIYTQPVRYGFFLRESDMYPPLKARQVEIDTSITSLADFAISMGINYRILKDFNPWLISNRLPNESGKTYILSIPDPDDLGYKALFDDLKLNEGIFNDTLSVGEI